MSPAERVRLHLQAAEALEELYRPDPEPHLAELAHHFLRAIPGSGLDKAIAYARRAGMQEMGRLAYEEAAVHFSRALEAFDLAPASDDRERCELLLALGEAQSRAGDPERARNAFRRAAEIARRLGASEPLARAALGLGGRGYTDIGIVDAPLTELLEEALAALGESNEPLRARLLARLAEELASSFSPAARERGGALSGEAVRAARRASDPRALAKALHARFFALWGPDTVVERLELTTEMVSVAEEAGDKDMAFMGRVRRLITLVETDDLAALDSETAALTRLADELREPTHRWNLLEIRGGLALREGRFEEAERFIRETFALGEQLQKVDAGPIFTGQMLALRRARGRAGEMEPAIRSQIEQFPEITYWRCDLALLHCELGREAEARAEFEQIAANDFGDLPRNFVWLGSLAILSQVAAHLADRRRAALLYDRLLPYEKRTVALGTSWSWGAAARYLGLLCATMGRYDDGARHFENATAMNARIRAVPFLAHTQADYARMLLSRDDPGDREKGVELLERAASVAESLGMKVLLETARTVGTSAQIANTEAAKTAESNVFRKEGDYWTIVYDGETARLKDSKGLGYIAYLLQHPGSEFHAAELLGTLEGRSDAGDAGAILDPEAKAAYRRRLEELREEAEEAERFNDPGRASKARREMEVISAQLAAAIGLGGRDRKAASGAERARVTVTKRIKAVLEKIRERNRALGRHLVKNLKTGYFCSYTPEHPVSWQS